jgi:uncharacterized SAM-binding protein YcdF (DUF218 family)
MGVREEMFWTESESRSTYESGIAVSELLEERFPDVEEHTIILVTSAIHMPRSIMVMNRVGIWSVPSAADYKTGVFSLDVLSFVPSAGNFDTSCSSLHEWLGMVAYRLRYRFAKRDQN